MISPKVSIMSLRLVARYLVTAASLLLATAIGLSLGPGLHPLNIALLYLAIVVLTAWRWGLGPSVLASFMAVLLLDAYVIPPLGILSIGGWRDLIPLSVFLIISVVISQLGTRLQAQIDRAGRWETRTAALYAMSRDMALAKGSEQIVQAALDQICRALDADAIILLAGEGGELQPGLGAALGPSEWQAAREAFQGQLEDSAGSSGPAPFFLPLQTANDKFGVLGLRQRGGDDLSADQRRLLETFAGQIAIALEHEQLSAQAEQAKLLEASEHLRNALLSSLSHDLRTPLASIIGSVTSLLDRQAQLDDQARQDLLLTIKEEGSRLNRLVTNLLNMTRAEAGALRPQCEWQSLEEVIGSALQQTSSDHRVHLDIDPELPLAPFDFALIEQVMLNLLDNAYKFSPGGEPIDVSVRHLGRDVEISVADRGIGIPAGEFDRVFEKFYRVRENRSVPGTGLGLSICKAIVEAHGGTIWAEANEGGGTRITFTLPAALAELEK